MKKSYQGWLDFANRDLLAAKELVKNEYLANIVMFHCQQCIEKSIKGLLEFYNITPPKIHGIGKLFSLIPDDIKEKILISEDEINLIDDIYIDMRYPGNFGLLPTGFPSKKQAEKLLESQKMFIIQYQI